MKTTKLITVSAIALLAVGGQAVSAAEGALYGSKGGVQFVPNTDPTNPVNPTDPDPEVPVNPIDPVDPEGPNPGTDGPLSIDFASSLDFGVNKIANTTQTYFARAQTYTDIDPTPNYVQVSDNRGTNAGWTLKVKQESQFSATTPTLNNLLTGAQITLKNASVASNSSATAPTENDDIILNPNGAESLVMSAANLTGAGTWVNTWGAVETISEVDSEGETVEVAVTKDVALEVPGSTPKDAVKYQTNLVWTLTDVPRN